MNNFLSLVSLIFPFLKINTKSTSSKYYYYYYRNYDFNKLKELCRPDSEDKLQNFINTTVDYAMSLSIATKSVVVLKQK